MITETYADFDPYTAASGVKRTPRKGTIKIMLTGDVMTGRGIDQILKHPCDPTIHELHMSSALDYVRLAEWAYGVIPRGVDSHYVWGDMLSELKARRPDASICNLETAITNHDRFEDKGINYRMSPRNISVLTAGGFDCCVLANNHTLDWGVQGLRDTLDNLHGIRIHTAGAGNSPLEATAPAIIPVSGGRVLVFAAAHRDCGAPRHWASLGKHAGISILPEYSEDTVSRIADRVEAVKRPGDIAIFSVHWGGNWGYEVDPRQVWFARRLIDYAGIDVVHGHSSHHPKECELHNGHLIIYGCGDLLNDYEGISGHELFRADLTLLYFLTVQQETGHALALELVPMQVRHFRLRYAGFDDARWLARKLDAEYAKFGGGLSFMSPRTLTLEMR